MSKFAEPMQRTVFPCATLRGGTMNILKALKDRRNEYQHQIDTIDAAIKLLGGAEKKHMMSAASRRKMSLAAKKRWAEKKKSK
jgi:hypothetical protein